MDFANLYLIGYKAVNKLQKEFSFQIGLMCSCMGVGTPYICRRESRIPEGDRAEIQHLPVATQTRLI